MGEYRIVRRLSSAATLVESYAGVRVDRPAELPVMVKRLVSPWRGDSAFLGRFGPVLQHLSRLSHDGVARVVEAGIAEGLVCVVEDLVDGESVRQVTSSAARAGVRIPPNELLSVVASAAHVLAELHEDAEPLVHGDVNASTIVLARTGGVKLVSTGIARCAGNADGHGPARSEVGALAPEQLSGAGSAATDVFQLGLLLYELLSGQALFAGGEHAAVAPQVRNHQSVDPARMTGAPPTLTQLVSRMMAREPQARPPALEVELTLRQLAEQFGWSLSERDAAVLFARVFAERPPLSSTLSGPGQVLKLKPVTQPPRPATTPSAGVALGRIATRRVTLSEVSKAVVQGALLDETPAAPPEPVLPPGHDAAQQMVTRGFITQEQLEAAVESVHYYGGTVVEALVAGGVLAEDTVVTVLAEQTHTPSLHARKLAEMHVPPEVLARVDAKLAEELMVVPLSMKGESQLMVAMRDPLDEKVVGKLREVTRVPSIVGVRAGPTALKAALARLYPKGAAPAPDWQQSKDGSPGPKGFDIKLPEALPEPPKKPPSVAWLNPVPGPLVPSPGLSAVQLKLVAGALALKGAEGEAANSFVELAVKTAAQLGASEGDLDRLRFAAAVLVVAALSENKAPGLAPAAATVERLLGDDWPKAAPVLRQVLDGQLTGADAVALGLFGAISLATAARAPLGVPGAARRGFDALTSAGQLPVSLMQALAQALA